MSCGVSFLGVVLSLLPCKNNVNAVSMVFQFGIEKLFDQLRI